MIERWQGHAQHPSPPLGPQEDWLETFGCQSETLSNNCWSLIDLAVQSRVLNCLESSSSNRSSSGGVFMKGLLSAKSSLKIMDARLWKWALDLSATVCLIIYKTLQVSA